MLIISSHLPPLHITALLPSPLLILTLHQPLALPSTRSDRCKCNSMVLVTTVSSSLYLYLLIQCHQYTKYLSLYQLAQLTAPPPYLISHVSTSWTTSSAISRYDIPYSQVASFVLCHCPTWYSYASMDAEQASFIACLGNYAAMLCNTAYPATLVHASVLWVPCMPQTHPLAPNLPALELKPEPLP